MGGYERWNRGSPTPGPGLADEFEFHPPPDLLGEAVYRGPGAIVEFERAMKESWGSLLIEPIEVEEGGDRAMARVRISVSGRHTKIDISRDEYHVWSFEGDMPSRVQCFTSREAALEVLDPG